MFGNFAFKLTQIIQWITSVLNVMLQCYQEQIMACTGSQFYSIQFLDDKLSSRDCFTLRSWWHNALWETFHLGKWIMSHQCVGNYCVGKRNDLFFQTFETRDLRICWNIVILFCLLIQLSNTTSAVSLVLLTTPTTASLTSCLSVQAWSTAVNFSRSVQSPAVTSPC